MTLPLCSCSPGRTGSRALPTPCVQFLDSVIRTVALYVVSCQVIFDACHDNALRARDWHDEGRLETGMKGWTGCAWQRYPGHVRRFGRLFDCRKISGRQPGTGPHFVALCRNACVVHYSVKKWPCPRRPNRPLPGSDIRSKLMSGVGGRFRMDRACLWSFTESRTNRCQHLPMSRK
jgi:hypothetical protein